MEDLGDLTRFGNGRDTYIQTNLGDAYKDLSLSSSDVQGAHLMTDEYFQLSGRSSWCWQLLGEVTGAGSCLEGVPGTGEGMEDDPTEVDISTVGYVTSREAMVDV